MNNTGTEPHRPAAIRQGGVYYVQDVEPLDGGRDKNRYVIVVEDPESLAAGVDPVVVVCCSSTVTDREPDRIPMPNRATTPSTKSGLPIECWAMPRWRFAAERVRLDDHRGFIRGEKLQLVVEAYLKRVDEAAQAAGGSDAVGAQE